MGMRDRPHNAVTRVVRRASQLSGARNTFTSFANSFCALWPPPSPPNLDFIGSVSQTTREYLTFFRPLPNTLLFTPKRIAREYRKLKDNFWSMWRDLAWSNFQSIRFDSIWVKFLKDFTVVCSRTSQNVDLYHYPSNC